MRHIIRMTNLELTRIIAAALHVPDGQLKVIGFEGILFDKSTFIVRADWDMALSPWAFPPTPPAPPQEAPKDPIPAKIKKHEVK